jgi:hypothetical protein
MYAFHCHLETSSNDRVNTICICFSWSLDDQNCVGRGTKRNTLCLFVITFDKKYLKFFNTYVIEAT